MIQTVSIKVTGIVQGVFYRQSTKAKALEINVKGEVKNNPDGSVAIIATGTDEQLRQLVEWCHRGPDTAVVANVEVNKLPRVDYKDFRVVKM